MSDYETFFQDFPNRCFDLLDPLMSVAKQKGREVTFTLAMATSAFVVPFERLNSEPGQHLANDAVRYTEAKEVFRKTLQMRFFEFYPDGKYKSWKLMDAVPIDTDAFSSDPLGYWESLGDQRQDLDNFDTRRILKILRNALAHGNIFTLPKDRRVNKEIKTLVFVSNVTCYKKAVRLDEDKKRCKCMVSTGKYDVIMVSPADFLQFLKAWVNFVKSLPTTTIQIE